MDYSSSGHSSVRNSCLSFEQCSVRSRKGQALIALSLRPLRPPASPSKHRNDERVAATEPRMLDELVYNDLWGVQQACFQLAEEQSSHREPNVKASFPQRCDNAIKVVQCRT